ncbi:MAG: M20 family metallopeptidase [Rhizobiales bacterium]|nr:M20 family metallopeptidase [Hyphomicrobiales bacterium]OJY01948.1 MAG: acetylornithine deacetylase [Rhizobiales bacterium 63-22]
MNLRPDAARMKRDLAELVAINSENPPGGEGAVARWVRERLAPLGFTLKPIEYAPGRFNIEAWLENGPGPVFAFNTHMDTVPAGDGWTSDAFVLTERDGRLYGRGSCDCKGPLAAMIEALRMLVGERKAWSGTLMAVFTGDEEVASAGARHYAAARPKINAVVVGEPTGNACFSAHKGSFRPVVRVAGKAAHSGSPHLGENAIFRAGELMPLLAAFHEGVLAQRSYHLVGNPSLTVTRIRGGHADNVIPAECELLLDRRLIPGETDASAEAEIRALLADAERKHGIRAEIVGYHATTGGATDTPETAPVVQAAIAACRAAGVAEPGPFGFQGACDLVHFIEAGAEGVVIGAGDIRVAHRPDEFVPADEFVASATIYADVARRILAV